MSENDKQGMTEKASNLYNSVKDKVANAAAPVTNHKAVQCTAGWFTRFENTLADGSFFRNFIAILVYGLAAIFILGIVAVWFSMWGQLGDCKNALDIIILIIAQLLLPVAFFFSMRYYFRRVKTLTARQESDITLIPTLLFLVRWSSEAIFIFLIAVTPLSLIVSILSPATTIQYMGLGSTYGGYADLIGSALMGTICLPLVALGILIGARIYIELMMIPLAILDGIEKIRDNTKK